LPLFFCFIAGMTALLLIMCFLKGEPTRWRWGSK
jgi:hypothetical protein